MKKQTAKQIMKEIDSLTSRIELLKGKIEEHDNLNIIYNKLLIERAVSKEKLKELQSNNLISFIVKKFEKRDKTKLISDYFKTKIS